MSQKLFGPEDVLEFKRRFAIEFLAAYVANQNDACCADGQHELLQEPPVEDAEFLAEKAWEYWVKVIGLRDAKAGA